MLYKVDVAKVKGKMAEKGLSLTAMAEKLDIDRNTLSQYLKNPRKIPYRVLDGMACYLCDSEEEAQKIFFAN